MTAKSAVVIMVLMAVIGFILGVFIVNDEAACVGSAILFALISGIGCIIQAINKKPTDTEK